MAPRKRIKVKKAAKQAKAPCLHPPTRRIGKQCAECGAVVTDSAWGKR